MSELRASPSKATSRLLFTSNPLPMWVYDVDTLAFLEVNDAAIAHYGYSRDEFLTMQLGDIRPAGEVPRLRQVVASLAVTGHERAPYHAGSWQHRLKDGRIRDVDISSHAIEFAGRRAVLVVATDVTALRMAQAALAKHAELPDTP